MRAMKEKNFVSVVAYVRNDEGRITKFLDCIEGILAPNFQNYEIILVDDDSTDASVDRIKAHAASEAGCMVQVVHMSYAQGVEMAMNAGVDLAIGDYVFEFDSVACDYEPRVILEVYERLLKGVDIVRAVPPGGGGIASSAFYFLYNHFSKNQYALRTERFRILSRRAINRIRSLSKTVPYRKALYANCGLLQDAVVYEPLEREGTTSPASFRLRLALDALIIFTDVGYKFALLLSAGMIAGSVLIAVYVAVIFYTRQPVSGWASIMWLLSVGFAGTFAMAAVIIKYLDVIIGLVFKKRNYTFSSIEKLTK